MHIIQNNPYRTVGLLVGATAKEQERQVRRLKQFIEADQEPEDDFSFPALGHIDRTIESVTDAASKLNLDSDKMNAALFWFYKGNPITDEAAFDAIKEGNTDTAIEIWRKLAYNLEDNTYNEVTKRNASAFHNLSTLYFQKYGIDEDTLHLKLLFLESNFFNELKNSATDETYKISSKEVQLLFLNSLTIQEEFDFSEFIDAISGVEFIAKDEFSKSLIQKPIEQLERLLNECKERRKLKKEDVIVAGTSLYNEAKPILNQIKGILGVSDIKYTSISDKISDEVLQCGIELFNNYKDHETFDPGEPAMKLFARAKSLAIGSIAKQRCQENTENLKEWIDDKPEREKQAKILADFEKLKKIIDEFEERSPSIASGKQLLANARPHLNNIKNILGSTDELYLGISTRIASDAQGMCVSEVNQLQEMFANTYDHTKKIVLISLLKEKVNDAWEVATTIGTMDLRQDFRAGYTKNRTSLSNLKTQLVAVNTGRVESSQGEFNFAENAWWILGIAGVLIGLMADLGGGCIVTGLIGAGIGAKLSN